MGRILTSGGAPQGTCFQIDRSGYLVTAWHVVQTTLGLEEIPVETVEVTVDSLGDPDVKPTRAWVVARNHRADLALLKTGTPLPGTARLLRPTRSAEQGEEVTMVGHAVIEDGAHVPPSRSVEALGRWQGEVTRTDGLRLGRIQSSDVMPGMSGAPVRRLGDDSVLGVISSRHNTTDSWMAHSVWVSRTEELHELCKGHVPRNERRWLGFAGAAAGGAAAGYTVSEYVRDRGAGDDTAAADGSADSGGTAGPGDSGAPSGSGEPSPPSGSEGSDATTSSAADLPVSDQVPGGSGLSDAVADEAAAEVSEGVLKKTVGTIIDWLL
ncbi:serine protease [Nocardiopsis sp. NPDC050513]|uniref:serine protease n=1 Tax=Nocardiopsis sp. NPDC050513 TaxID=3364338 RepID=UPI0037B8F85F